MKAIFVDATVVTTPGEDDSKDAVEEWLYSLQAWLREALHGHYQWLHSVKATELLDTHGRFPRFETLKPLMMKYKIDISLPLLMREINAFFREETLDLGNKLEELEYLVEVEKGTVHIQPEVFSQRWLDCIQPDMMQLLITACACKHSSNAFAQDLHIVTLKLPDSTREIEVSAIIIDALPPLECDAGRRIMQTFPLIFTPDDLPHLDSDRMVLEKIVRMAAAVMADRAMEVKCNLRHLRVSKTADSPQLTRASDGAKAWRLTLTDKGVGWRMHYWRIPDAEGSIIEFANVLKKHDPEEIY